MFKWLKSLFQSVNPRYFYHLDDIKYQQATKTNLYVFKTYGAHTFTKLTFSEISDSRKLRWLINPDDLTDIYLLEKAMSDDKKIYRIKESQRKNDYLLSKYNESVTISGDEFCNTPTLIEQTNSLDAHKISYHTGFLHGREFAKQLQAKTEAKSKASDNVVKLQVCE